MRVWVQRRLEAGTVLAQPVCLGGQFEPLELLVQTVTDQGQRPLTKVARLFPLGQRRAIDELISPKMYWLKKGQFVLTGTEQLQGQHRKAKCPAQSWLCTLAIDVFVDRFIVAFTYRRGEKLSRRELADSYVSHGALSMVSSVDAMLGRATIRADLLQPGAQPAYGRNSLLDVDLEWMGAENFEISGFEHVPAHAGSHAVTLRQGWLCRLDPAVDDDDSIGLVRAPRRPKIQR